MIQLFIFVFREKYHSAPQPMSSQSPSAHLKAPNLVAYKTVSGSIAVSGNSVVAGSSCVSVNSAVYDSWSVLLGHGEEFG